jgi:hypothetical protein
MVALALWQVAAWVDDGLSLGQFAREARATGRTSAGLTMLGEEAPVDALSEVLEWQSLIVVTAERPSARKTVELAAIYTWHVFREEERLHTAGRAPPIVTCYRPPSGLLEQPGELALGAFGGDAAIDGVTITLSGPLSELRFPAGERFLMIATVCPSRTVIPYHREAIYPLQGDAIVVPEPWLPVSQEIARLGTGSAVRKRLLAGRR